MGSLGGSIDGGGWMQNDRGIELTDINWVQAGANAPGREEKVELNLPEGINLERIKGKSLSQLLACGEIDCAIIAGPRHAPSKTIPISSDCSLTTSKWKRRTSKKPVSGQSFISWR